MRRLLWPVGTPLRRTVLVAAVALAFLARHVPCRPRYSAPTEGRHPVGFSPDGRLFALHSQHPRIRRTGDCDEPGCGRVFVHDLSGSGGPERCVRDAVTASRGTGEPLSSWPFWDY